MIFGASRLDIILVGLAFTLGFPCICILYHPFYSSYMYFWINSPFPP